MKKLLSVLISALPLILFVNVQAQQNTFSKILYDSTDNFLHAYSIVPSFNNGYIMTGEFGYKGIVLKIDSAGNPIWNRIIDRINTTDYLSFRLRSLTRTYDSCYVIAGDADNSPHGKIDALVIKMNDDGDTIWTKTFTHDYYLYTKYISQTLDSGYIFVGYTYEFKDLYC